MLGHRVRKRYCKTFGTSVINSLLSPLSLLTLVSLYIGCTTFALKFTLFVQPSKTVTKKVLVSGGDSDISEIPAEYQTVSKRVLRTPATVKEVVIPAEYKTITKRVLTSPARDETIEIPAEYKTISDRKLVRAGGFTRWVEIVCAGDTNSDLIRQVQRALKDRGYDPGPIDGVLGTRTKSALQQYQEKSGLPVGNLNKETLGSLGVGY